MSIVIANIGQAPENKTVGRAYTIGRIFPEPAIIARHVLRRGKRPVNLRKEHKNEKANRSFDGSWTFGRMQNRRRSSKQWHVDGD
jgi:hypothetical protein